MFSGWESHPSYVEGAEEGSRSLVSDSTFPTYLRRAHFKRASGHKKNLILSTLLQVDTHPPLQPLLDPE